MKGEEYDYAKLADILKGAPRRDYPDKNDIAVKSDDAVIYNKIIRTMDIGHLGRFPDIGLADKGGG